MGSQRVRHYQATFSELSRALSPFFLVPSFRPQPSHELFTLAILKNFPFPNTPCSPPHVTYLPHHFLLFALECPSPISLHPSLPGLFAVSCLSFRFQLREEVTFQKFLPKPHTATFFVPCSVSTWYLAHASLTELMILNYHQWWQKERKILFLSSEPQTVISVTAEMEMSVSSLYLLCLAQSRCSINGCWMTESAQTCISIGELMMQVMFPLPLLTPSSTLRR